MLNYYFLLKSYENSNNLTDTYYSESFLLGNNIDYNAQPPDYAHSHVYFSNDVKIHIVVDFRNIIPNKQSKYYGKIAYIKQHTGSQGRIVIGLENNGDPIKTCNCVNDKCQICITFTSSVQGIDDALKYLNDRVDRQYTNLNISKGELDKIKKRVDTYFNFIINSEIDILKGAYDMKADYIYDTTGELFDYWNDVVNTQQGGSVNYYKKYKKYKLKYINLQIN